MNSQTPFIIAFFTNLLEAASEISVRCLVEWAYSISRTHDILYTFSPIFLNHRNTKLIRLSCIIGMNVPTITKHNLELVWYHIIMNTKHEKHFEVYVDISKFDDSNIRK